MNKKLLITVLITSFLVSGCSEEINGITFLLKDSCEIDQIDTSKSVFNTDYKTIEKHAIGSESECRDKCSTESSANPNNDSSMKCNYHSFSYRKEEPKFIENKNGMLIYECSLNECWCSCFFN